MEPHPRWRGPGVGFETIQFAAKFGGPPVTPSALVAAARRAGFGWLAFDRHTLAQAARTGGGLEALAKVCATAGLPCRAIQSLRITGDAAETAAAIEQVTAQADVLHPDVIPLILLTEPTRPVLGAIRAAMAQVSDCWRPIRFGLEFGPVFPVADLQSARRVVHSIGVPGVGLVVDSWHLFNGVTPWSDVVTLEGAEVALVQLNDHGPLAGTLVHEAKNHRLLPGTGCFPLQDLLDVLWAAGYRGLMSVEVISAELRGEGPSRFARRAFGALTALRYGPLPLTSACSGP